jgi:hypothetical protein
MANKLEMRIERTLRLSGGENLPSRRAKIRKIARKPAKATPSSAISASSPVPAIAPSTQPG